MVTTRSEASGDYLTAEMRAVDAVASYPAARVSTVTGRMAIVSLE